MKMFDGYYYPERNDIPEDVEMLYLAGEEDENGWDGGIGIPIRDFESIEPLWFCVYPCYGLVDGFHRKYDWNYITGNFELMK